MQGSLNVTVKQQNYAASDLPDFDTIPEAMTPYCSARNTYWWTPVEHGMCYANTRTEQKELIIRYIIHHYTYFGSNCGFSYYSNALSTNPI